MMQLLLVFYVSMPKTTWAKHLIMLLVGQQMFTFSILWLVVFVVLNYYNTSTFQHFYHELTFGGPHLLFDHFRLRLSWRLSRRATRVDLLSCVVLIQYMCNETVHSGFSQGFLGEGFWTEKQPVGRAVLILAEQLIEENPTEVSCHWKPREDDYVSYFMI